MAQAQAAAEPGTNQVDATPKRSRKKALLALGTVLALCSAGGGWWYYAGAETSTQTARETPPVFLPLEPFTVNLRPERAHQYLQVGLSIKLTNHSATDALKLHMPEIRSRMLIVLSTKGSSELLTAEGKQALAEELAAEVRRPLRSEAHSRSVQGIVFTSFVIQ